MRAFLPWYMLLFSLVPAATARAAESAPSRGQLLYETHCIECHSMQIHWRDKRQAQDWAGLRAQVGQWQARGGLGWSSADIEAVARHLDRAIYRLADTPARAE